MIQYLKNVGKVFLNIGKVMACTKQQHQYVRTEKSSRESF